MKPVSAMVTELNARRLRWSPEESIKPVQPVSAMVTEFESIIRHQRDWLSLSMSNLATTSQKLCAQNIPMGLTRRPHLRGSVSEHPTSLHTARQTLHHSLEVGISENPTGFHSAPQGGTAPKILPSFTQHPSLYKRILKFGNSGNPTASA